MNHSKILLIFSALFMAALGLILSFFPSEILSAFAIPTHPMGELMAQLLGGIYFGFAMLNWMARGNAIGGIYNKPLAVGNFAHFGIGAITLVKAMSAIDENTLIINNLMVCYTLFGAGFAFLFLRTPPQVAEN